MAPPANFATKAEGIEKPIMKTLVSEFRDFLLSEGILEKETTAISRDIIDGFKKLLSSGVIYKSRMPYQWIETSIPETLEGTADVNSIQVKVSIPQNPHVGPHGERPTRPVNINAAFGTLQRIPRTLYINLTINKEVATSDDELRSSISSWLPELKSLIRHELEHVRQSVKKAKRRKGSEEYTGTHLGKWLNGSRKDAIQYLRSPEERESYVVGLFKRAKMNKKPFNEIFQDWLSSMRFQVLMMKPASPEDLKDADIQKHFQDIEDEYLDYAASRFRDATIDTPTER